MDKITMEEVNARRAIYMGSQFEDQSRQHQKYYKWLAESIGITPKMLPPGYEHSKDPHFNDIPLRQWDAQHNWVLANARSHFSGKFSWSLSDSVCCLKAIAQRERDKHKETI